MVLRPVTLESPIREKIAWAEAVLQGAGPGLLGDRAVTLLLSDLNAALGRTRLLMAESGMTELCRECDETQGGSCCGAGLENHYSGTLLLINLLLGAVLPKKRKDPTACFFLGDRGCRLPVRHTICINYVCPMITGRLTPERLAPLRKEEGILLDCLFRLQERITRLLREAWRQGAAGGG